MTDAQLLERAQQGDGAAWDQLHDRLFPSVWREACARVSDRSVAEDVTSETMLALVRSLHTLQPETCKLHGWVRQVVRNKISDWARRKERHARAVQSIAYNGASSPRLDATDAALVTEKRLMIMSVLAEVREDHRVILELKYTEDLSVRDIAARMGQTEKAVESLLFRARSEFRRKYEIALKQDSLPAPADATK